MLIALLFLIYFKVNCTIKTLLHDKWNPYIVEVYFVLIAVIDNKLSLQRQEDAAEFLFSALNTMATQEIDSFPDK